MEKTVVADHGSITDVDRSMEIALHETGHFVALCATGLYDEFTSMTDLPRDYCGARVHGLTMRSGTSLMAYSRELCAAAQKLASDPGMLKDDSVREAFGKAADVCLPHVCFFLGGGVVDGCFGTGSEQRNQIDHGHVKNELLATMRLPCEDELVRQMGEMVNGFLRGVFARESESVTKIARLLKKRGTLDKRDTDGALLEDVNRIRRNAEAEYAKLLVDFRRWWMGKVAPLA